jgi:hypothetical protein
MKSVIKQTLVASALVVSFGAQAAVSPEEAAHLKTDLTPVGAEKAGNKDGSIPAWTGGDTKPIPGSNPNGVRGDPFKDEKPVVSITASNMAQYADKLSDGVQALLKKYPDYRVDVYPTHRTAAAPQSVYDNTFKNATRAKMTGYIPSDICGGIPFPIPKSGQEVMWNHLLRWRGEAWEVNIKQYQITADGKMVITTEGVNKQQMPYYRKDCSPETFDGFYWTTNLTNTGPAIRAGEMIAGRENFDAEKTVAYVYLTGQRRVRKLPNPCCDTPTPATAGLMSFDEINVWTGRLDRFDWKIIGKKEVYIPYNDNKWYTAKTDSDVVRGTHLNPDYVRWELHRVWVVEATLKPGQRHQAAKSRYYVDEDTWNAVLADRWDANGQLWKSIFGFTMVMPDVPGAIQAPFGYYDLLAGTAFISHVYAGLPYEYRIVPKHPDAIFTGEGLAAMGVR